MSHDAPGPIEATHKLSPAPAEVAVQPVAPHRVRTRPPLMARRRRPLPRDIDTNVASIQRWRAQLGRPAVTLGIWEIEKRRQRSIATYARQQRRRP